jgi:hypothetical protein
LAPLFADLLRAGFDYMVRVRAIYEQALEQVGGDPSLCRRFAALGLQIDEFERRANQDACGTTPTTSAENPD